MTMCEAPVDPALPPAYSGCHCECHRIPNVSHCMPCCSPTQETLIGECPICGVINGHAPTCLRAVTLCLHTIVLRAFPSCP